MLQLILHGIGDYIIQNDWMALNKKKKGYLGFCACIIHCGLYSFPFFLIGSPLAVSIIFTTHFIIDRWRIVDYFLAIRNGVYKQRAIFYHDGEEVRYRLDISNFGFGKDRPFAISIWLYIITDNIFHIICNYLALTYANF